MFIFAVVFLFVCFLMGVNVAPGFSMTNRFSHFLYSLLFKDQGLLFAHPITQILHHATFNIGKDTSIQKQIVKRQTGNSFDFRATKLDTYQKFYVICVTNRS